jgi:hypothetical protein
VFGQRAAPAPSLTIDWFGLQQEAQAVLDNIIEHVHSVRVLICGLLDLVSIRVMTGGQLNSMQENR